MREMVVFWGRNGKRGCVRVVWNGRKGRRKWSTKKEAERGREGREERRSEGRKEDNVKGEEEGTKSRENR